ncbi:hypothetical protein JB92DRAFT_2941569 [Gautieria morchelliformis]|nr:hypothetical protein JB92DRAFT_2941569 [Gautieria morchelliformis]
MHGRSQSSVTPHETHNYRARSRRHGIPANFLESVGAASGGTKTLWNGQRLGPEHRMHSQAPMDRSPSSAPSQTVLVHPSASAPVTSYLSNIDSSLSLVPTLAPIHEIRTDPAMFSASVNSSGHAPLPRSAPSYNLAGFTPSSSGSTKPRHTADMDPHLVQRSHRDALPQPVVPDASHRPQRSSPRPKISSSPTKAGETHIPQHQLSNHHSTSPVGSEMETGYRGLAFPCPPSNEEGLAVSCSSSQSSLFSTISARRSGELPSTPKKIQDGRFRGEQDYDRTLPGSTESRGAAPGSGRSARDRNASISVGNDKASPTPHARTTKQKVDGVPEDIGRELSHKSGVATNGGHDTNHQAHVANGLEGELGVRSNQDVFSDGTYLPTRVRAVSETPHPPLSSAHPQNQPEPTQPLVQDPPRNMLHAMRSFTTLVERKQLQTSSSSRDLSGAYNSANGRGERGRAITAIPVRVGAGVQNDRDGPAPVSVGPVVPIKTQRSEGKSSDPPSFPLPTPPNSSSALSFVANEAKRTDGVSTCPPAGVGMPAVPSLTLEEVTEALCAQRVRFDELSGHVLDLARRHMAEKHAYVERVGRLEDTVAKLEREISGLRWLVLENNKGRGDPAAAAEEQSSESQKIEGKLEGVANDRRLRRSSTMPQLPTLARRPGRARNRRRFGGLGLDFSPESTGLSHITKSSLATSSRDEVDMDDGAHSPSMDEIIDKLMAVRQWACSDVRVSVVETTGQAGDSKRIVFRDV